MPILKSLDPPPPPVLFFSPSLLYINNDRFPNTKKFKSSKETSKNQKIFGINSIATDEANGKSGTVIVGAMCFFFRWESAATPIQPPIFLFVCRGRPPLGRGHPILSYITPTHSLHNRDRNCPPQSGIKIFGDRPQRSNKLN